MTTRRAIPRAAAGFVAGGLALLPLTGCSDATVGSDSADVSASLPSPPSAEATVDAGDTEVSADCSGTSCELTLGSGQEANVLGTTVSFSSSDDGVATLQADGRDVTCRQGENVEAGPLTLECSTVTDDSVTLSASLG